MIDITGIMLTDLIMPVFSDIIVTCSDDEYN